MFQKGYLPKYGGLSGGRFTRIPTALRRDLEFILPCLPCIIDVSKGAKKKRKTPAWHDEDDDNLEVKDVTASYTKAVGKHGRKETSTENYAQSLRKNFSNLMDRPKWANLQLQKDSEEDSDDEFFRETTDTLATGKSLSLKKGFIESRKLKGTYAKKKLLSNETLQINLKLYILIDCSTC